MKLTLKSVRKMFEKKKKKMSEDEINSFADRFWTNFNNQTRMKVSKI